MVTIIGNLIEIPCIAFEMLPAFPYATFSGSVRVGFYPYLACSASYRGSFSGVSYSCLPFFSERLLLGVANPASRPNLL